MEQVDVTLFSRQHGHQRVRLDIEAGMTLEAAILKASQTLRRRGMTNCTWQLVEVRRVEAQDEEV